MRWPQDRPLRVLEVGAGTNSLSTALLPLLPAERTPYTCTATSAAGCARAEHRFSAYDFIDYRTLDLGAEPVSQGLPRHGFDLIVAGDALHTTVDLAEALRHVHTLLAPGGLLLATEPHLTPRLGFLAGGTESFWQRRDRALRPETRLLSQDRWVPLLTECGFTGAVRTGAEDRSLLLAAADHHPNSAPPAPVPQPGATWVIATETPDETPTAQALAELLGRARTIAATDCRADWAAALSAEDVPPGVVLLLAATEAPDAITPRTTRRAAVLRALAGAGAGPRGGGHPQIWLVTRPSGLFPGPERPAHPADAAAWGAARTLANEHPSLRLRRICLDRTDDPDTDARRLAHELLTPTDEDEIVLTRAGRFVPRQTQHPVDQPVPAPSGAPYLLEVRDPGLSRRLVWRATEPQRPGPGEILVEIRAVGLNYRDPMRANGLLPPEAVEGSPLSRGLGTDGAGVIQAVGPGVTGLSVGDRVCGLMPAALASHAVTPAGTAIRIPVGMSFAEAATFPVAFLTIHHTLAEQARPLPGETVLVHGATGAVGLAVIQCARSVGARVIATAGTEVKRDLLRTLGVEHVLDSRTLDCVPKIREITGGQGVDVIVNSLSGEAIAHNVDLLRPNGRFIELGKRDIFRNSPLLLRPFHRNLTFIGFNLDNVVYDAGRGPHLMAEVTERIAGGVYRPLPHVVYPAARVDEAFRLLQHSRHTGKVVVSFDPLDEPVLVEPAPAEPALDPDGTYLITGGLGGFGAATADALADRGARHIALLGRRGATAPEAATVLDSLMTTEFLLRAREHFDIRISPTELLGSGRALTHFARLVHQRLGLHASANP
ncbi:zinc-binding dehydrogenase [Streptomyces sp. NPDC058000]|uniref:zinc-binding dehydrogenase n=1 Tax=Streptomyces sp. NPDC058000 TaxID=3346299 RepID=UPI0036E49C8D